MKKQTDIYSYKKFKAVKRPDSKLVNESQHHENSKIAKPKSS